MFSEALFEKYKSNGVLIDTNLLLLLTVGTYRRNRIETFKRTRDYTLDDLTLMQRIAAYFDRRLTTPNILTEVDNLLRQLPTSEHAAASVAFSNLVSLLFEIFVPTTQAVKQRTYAAFGLTDCVTASETKDILVITDDFRLSGMLTSLGRDAVNINHIRMLGWK